MKKVKVLGKMIPVFVLVLLGIGLVSGALVGYLSNQAKATVTVESPFQLKIVEGPKESTLTTKVEGIVWKADNSISFATYGGSTVTFTNYIKKLPNIDIPVNEKEVIRHVGDNDMTGLDKEFSFFGARYWRPQGSSLRLASYGDDINKGWDPYTDSSGVCWGQTDAGPTHSLAGASFVGIKDGICYYIGGAFSYIVVGGQLVSDYNYIYLTGFSEEIMQVVMTFALDIEPGTYEYSRIVNKQV